MNQTSLRVRYAETDQMGIVYHANYLVWMEIGRVELVRSLGFNYKELETSMGLLLSVVDVNCRYLSPARFDDEIVVETSLAKVNPMLLTFSYRMLTRKGDRLLTVGTTRHCWLNRGLRPARLPMEYTGILKAAISPGTNHSTEGL